jgi:hypothetical protein
MCLGSKKILNEIDNPEFPFFAVRNFRELFSFIFYHLPEVPPHHRVLTLQSKEQCEIKKRSNIMYNNLERRKYKRKEKPFMVRFRTIPLVAKKMVSTDWDMVPVKNLSAGGMLFDYNKNLELDSLLDFKIDISKYTPTINCVGKIIRIEELQPNSRLRIEIEFISIGEQEKELISKAIEEV